MVEEGQDLLSIRGLQEDFGTPIKEFKGVLVGYTLEPDKPAKLNFDQVEIIESSEPYPYPTCTIEIWPSNRVKSNWGIFGTSLGKIIPADQDLRDCISKVFWMKFTPGHMLRRKNKETEEWGDVAVNAWEVIEAGGAGGGATSGAQGMTAIDKAKALLDGKNVVDFNKAAMADDLVRSDPELLKSIVAKTFVAELVDSGSFTKDGDDVFHSA